MNKINIIVMLILLLYFCLGIHPYAELLDKQDKEKERIHLDTLTENQKLYTYSRYKIGLLITNFNLSKLLLTDSIFVNFLCFAVIGANIITIHRVRRNEGNRV